MFHIRIELAYNLAIPAFRTAAAHALIAVNNVFNRMVNSPVAPGYFFFCSSTKLVTVTHSVSINQNSSTANRQTVGNKKLIIQLTRSIVLRKDLFSFYYLYHHIIHITKFRLTNSTNQIDFLQMEQHSSIVPS